MFGLRIHRSRGRLIVEQRAIVGMYPIPVWTLYAVDGVPAHWIDVYCFT